MATARRRDAWDRTAALLAMLANVNRDDSKRSQPFSPADFHPLPDDTIRPAKTKPQEPQMKISELRGMFRAMGVEGA